MPRIQHKRLPPHWMYVPSRRTIREQILSDFVEVQHVDFAGTGSGVHTVGVCLGYLERRVVTGAWGFYLRFWGVPESGVIDHRDALSRAAVEVIHRSLTECLKIPARDELPPTQVPLWFRLEPGGVVPNCKVEPVTRWSFSAGAWWERPALGPSEPG